MKLRIFILLVVKTVEPVVSPTVPLDGTNIVFSHGKSRVIKIFPPHHKSHTSSFQRHGRASIPLKEFMAACIVINRD
jgi:hypothetical protein